MWIRWLCVGNVETAMNVSAHAMATHPVTEKYLTIAGAGWPSRSLLGVTLAQCVAAAGYEHDANYLVGGATTGYTLSKR